MRFVPKERYIALQRRHVDAAAELKTLKAAHEWLVIAASALLHEAKRPGHRTHRLPISVLAKLGELQNALLLRSEAPLDGTEHDLKIWPAYFDDVVNRIKRFELRENDRGYQVGDQLRLREWDPQTESYSGRWVLCLVLYVMSSERIADGYCIMSIDPLATGRIAASALAMESAP